MPKTTTKRTAKRAAKKTKKVPHELQAQLKQLQLMLDAAERAGMISGKKMARIQCPGCGTLDLGVAWSKETGWVVLCDTCHTLSPLDKIDPPDPETREVGTREMISLKRGSGSVN